jgi:hypothetical protein
LSSIGCFDHSQGQIFIGDDALGSDIFSEIIEASLQNGKGFFKVRLEFDWTGVGKLSEGVDTCGFLV